MSSVPAGARVPPEEPRSEAPVLNIANVLTGVRLLLVPFFVAALLVDGGHAAGWRFVAFVLFAVAAFTDRLDGELARRRGLVTSFGKIADPIADKALVGAALVVLSMLNLLPWWATLVIIAREVGITLLRFWVLRYGVIPASRGGKAKTLTQTIAIGFYLLPLESMLPALAGVVIALRWVLLAIAVALTVVTGLDYVLRALRLRAAALAGRRRA